MVNCLPSSGLIVTTCMEIFPVIKLYGVYMNTSPTFYLHHLSFYITTYHFMYYLSSIVLNYDHLPQLYIFHNDVLAISQLAIQHSEIPLCVYDYHTYEYFFRITAKCD